MKRFLLTFAVLFIVLLNGSLYSLSNFDYTGIAFDGSGALITSSSTVGVKIELIDSGLLKYSETHSNVTTDQFGAYTVTVGTGSNKIGNLTTTSATKTLKIKVTITNPANGGTWVVSSFIKLNNAVKHAAATSSGSGSSWGLTGNSGTTAGTNFLGTTDDKELRLEVRNSGTIEQSFRMNTNQAIYRETGIIGITGGSPRGQYAVDMQIGRSTATQVASGNYSTVSGGSASTASGYASTVGGGSHNTAGWEYSTVAGGGDNTAGAEYSTVGGGRNNTAAAQYSTVVGGYQAKADKFGQNAYASGRFASDGDAQTSVLVMRNETTNPNIYTNLYLDGNSQLLILNDQDVWAYRIVIVGTNNNASTKGAVLYEGGVWRQGNTVGYSISSSSHGIFGNISYPQLQIDQQNNALLVQVRGGTPQDPMRWVARVELTQLNY